MKIVILLFNIIFSAESLNVRVVSLYPFSPFETKTTGSSSIEIKDSLLIVGLFGGFWLFDIINPSLPRKIGEYITRGRICNILLKDNFLYVTDLERGFRIFDISSIPEIREVSGFYDRSYKDLVIKDTFAFVSQGMEFILPGREDTIEIFNIKNPLSPRRVSKFSIGRGFVTDMFISFDKIYIASHYGGLKIYDISNPETPIFLGDWISQNNDWWVYCCVVKDSFAFIGGRDTLRILNVSNPREIREVSKIRLGTYEGDELVLKLFMRDTFLYCGIWGDSGCLVSIANPPLPRILKRFDHWGQGLVLRNNILFSPTLHYIFIYDVATNDTVTLISKIFIPISLVEHVKPINDSLVFLSCWGFYHFIADISNPPFVRLRGMLPEDTISPYFMSYGSIPGIRDSFIFIGSFGGNSLYAYKFPNPDTIYLIDSLLLGQPPSVGVRSVILKDTLAFVVGNFWGSIGTLWIVNIKDPYNMILISTTTVENADFYNIFVKNNYAYIAGGQGGFLIIDISDIYNPRLISRVQPSYYMNNIFVKDTFAFLTDSWQGLAIFNVANPYYPREILRIPSRFQSLGVWAEGNLLYLCEGYGGLRVFNISNLHNPIEVGSYRIMAPAGGITVFNDLIHVAYDIGGYYVFQFYGTEISEEEKKEIKRKLIGKDIRVYNSMGQLVFKTKKRESGWKLKKGIYFLFDEKASFKKLIIIK